MKYDGFSEKVPKKMGNSTIQLALEYAVVETRFATPLRYVLSTIQKVRTQKICRLFRPL